MPTIRITSARHGASAVNYAMKQGKPHNEGLHVKRRVLASNANNCSLFNFRKQMQAVWSANHTHQRKAVELYRITQSFASDELNVDGEDWHENVRRANRAGTELAKQLYPDKMAVVSTQADGVGHKLHNHIIIVSPGMFDGKALRGERTNQGYIAHASDEICQKLGIKLSANLTPVEAGKLRTKGKHIADDNVRNQLNNRGQKSFLAQIQSSIDSISQRPEIEDLTQFKEALSDAGVDVKYRKRKSGKVTGISYKLNDGSMKRAVRANRLGSDYQLEHLTQLMADHQAKRLADNKRRDEILRKQRQTSLADSRASESDSESASLTGQNSSHPSHHVKMPRRKVVKRDSHSKLLAQMEHDILAQHHHELNLGHNNDGPQL